MQGTCTAVASGNPHGNRACTGAGASSTGRAAAARRARLYPPLRQRQLLGIDDDERGRLQDNGTCQTPAGQTCPNNLTCSGSACRTSCSADSDCVSTHLCADGTCIRKVTKLGVGSDYACALVNDGRLFCWGEGQSAGDEAGGARGSAQQRPAHADRRRLSPQLRRPPERRGLLLGRQRKRPAWQPEHAAASTGAVKVNGLSSSARSVAAGGGHSCAILSDNSLWCWGGNGSGEVGTGALSDRELTPKRVGTLSVTAVVCGGGHTCALSGNWVRCWGYNGYGELGTATIPTMEPPSGA